MWFIYQAWYWVLGFRSPYIGMFSYYWVHDQLMVWVSVNLEHNDSTVIRYSLFLFWLQTLSSCISRPKACPISCANKLPFLQNPKIDTNYFQIIWCSIYTLVHREDPNAGIWPVWVTNAVLFCGCSQGARGESGVRRKY